MRRQHLRRPCGQHQLAVHAARADARAAPCRVWTQPKADGQARLMRLWRRRAAAAAACRGWSWCVRLARVASGRRFQICPSDSRGDGRWGLCSARGVAHIHHRSVARHLLARATGLAARPRLTSRFRSLVHLTSRLCQDLPAMHAPFARLPRSAASAAPPLPWDAPRFLSAEGRRRHPPPTVACRYCPCPRRWQPRARSGAGRCLGRR